MDNVTHTLTGLMLARAGFGALAARGRGADGQKGTAVMLMLAANAPDMDVVGGLGGALSYLAIHRGYAHSLLCVPLVALAAMLLARLVARAPVSISAFAACVIGVLSHLLLDWTNIYGIRMFLPFSSRWLRLDITDIVDPWILLILLGAVAAPALAGLVGSEIASRKTVPPVRGWAKLALAALLFYEGGRWVLHERAVETLSSYLYGGGWSALRVTAAPSRFNPWAWRGIVEGRGFVAELPVDLMKDVDPSTARISYTVVSAPAAAEAALKTEPFQAFAKFNQLPFWRTTTLPDPAPPAIRPVTKVELIDLRFGSPERPGFEAIATVDGNGQVLDSQFVFGLPR